MMYPPYFLYGLSSFWWTTVLLRQLCKKWLAVLPPPSPPAPPPPLLLLCCCCCHIRVPLLRVPKRNMLCLAMPTDDSFFRCEICIFCDLMDFQRFAHRKHSQSKVMPE